MGSLQWKATNVQSCPKLVRRSPCFPKHTLAERKLSMLTWYVNMASLKTKTLKVAETISFHFCFISKSKLIWGTFFFFFFTPLLR